MASEYYEPVMIKGGGKTPRKFLFAVPVCMANEKENGRVKEVELNYLFDICISTTGSRPG